MADNEKEKVWVMIFIAQCPHCEHPRLDHSVLGSEPTEEWRNNARLGTIECERCHEKFRPIAMTCYQHVAPMSRNKSFHVRKQDT